MLSAPTRKVEVILRTSNLGVEVGGKTICQDFNLNIERGSRWAILGINGAGKTTLISTLAGIRAPETGSITLNDRPLGEFAPRERAMRIGLRLQDYHGAAETSVLDISL